MNSDTILIKRICRIMENVEKEILKISKKMEKIEETEKDR
jgi:Txe/YoeB family toxin of Txe-Axe toxin-antitoxin module